MRRLISCIAKVALVATAVTVAGPAAADFGSYCPPGGCVFDPETLDPGYGRYDFDYTVPPDGQKYRWTIDYTSDDPDARVSLDSPNQTEILSVFRNGADFTEELDTSPPYVFDQFFASGRTTIIVQAPREFDFCSLAGPDGTQCAAIVHIWGNGTLLRGPESAAFTATFTETAIPEPATWTLLLAGFGVVGAAQRRRQARTPACVAQ